VGRLLGHRSAVGWLLILTPLVAVTSATLTIVLPAAHRAPLGVVLLTVSAACWLTVLLAARRLHHVPHPRPLTVMERKRPLRPWGR
jgi:hypothetical protein